MCRCPHPPATAQLTPSSAKLSLPPNAADCFSALQNKTLLPPKLRQASKVGGDILLKINFAALYALWLLHLFTCISLVLATKEAFYDEHVFRCSWRHYRFQLVTNIEMSNYTQVAKPLTSVWSAAAAVRTAYLTGKTARPFTCLLTIYCQHYSLQYNSLYLRPPATSNNRKTRKRYVVKHNLITEVYLMTVMETTTCFSLYWPSSGP